MARVTFLLALSLVACAEPSTAERFFVRMVGGPGAPLSPPAPAPAPEPAAAKSDCPSGWRCDYQALTREPAPVIDRIVIAKGPHKLHLVAADTIVRSYDVALGWGGDGPKRFEGDGVTPIGRYRITGRLKTSPWHTMLAVSYPNLDDWKRFGELRARGQVPWDRGIGFGIAIHGRAQTMRDGEHKASDWTAGCVALDNDEIDEVAALVKNETAVEISD